MSSSYLRHLIQTIMDQNLRQSIQEDQVQLCYESYSPCLDTWLDAGIEYVDRMFGYSHSSRSFRNRLIQNINLSFNHMVLAHFRFLARLILAEFWFWPRLGFGPSAVLARNGVWSSGDFGPHRVSVLAEIGFWSRFGFSRVSVLGSILGWQTYHFKLIFLRLRSFSKTEFGIFGIFWR